MKKIINKVQLPKIDNKGPKYTTDLSNPIYEKNLPPGFEQVQIAMPKGYMTPQRVIPELSAAASKLLSRINSENLPYNYNESIVLDMDGKPIEYLFLFGLHFDNHPKANSSLEGKQHPPYWHPGVSVFQKKPSDISKKDAPSKPKKSKKAKEVNDLVVKFAELINNHFNY